MERVANLEQAHVGKATSLVARRSPQQSRQEAGAHVRHVCRDRVLQHRSIITAAKQRCRFAINERIGDAFVVTQRRCCPFCSLLAQLQRGQNWSCDTSQTWQGFADKFGQGRNARDFFDEVSLALNVGPPAWHMCHVALQTKAKCGQCLALRAFGNIHAHKRNNPFSVKFIGARYVRYLPRDDQIGRLAARMINDHPHRMFQPIRRERGVNAAFETVARVGMNFQRTPRISNLDWVPIGAFDEHIYRVLGAAGISPTHDAPDALRASVVGNDHLARLQRVVFVVERHQRFAARSAVNP